MFLLCEHFQLLFEKDNKITNDYTKSNLLHCLYNLIQSNFINLKTIILQNNPILYDTIINDLLYYITIEINDISYNNIDEYEYSYFQYYNNIFSSQNDNNTSISSNSNLTIVTEWRYYNEYEWISVNEELNDVLNRCNELKLKIFNFTDSIGVKYQIDLDNSTITFIYNNSCLPYNNIINNRSVYILSHLSVDELFEKYISSLESCGFNNDYICELLLSDEEGCTHAYQLLMKANNLSTHEYKKNNEYHLCIIILF